MIFRLLLLWTLAALVHCNTGSEIKVENYPNKIKLICKDGTVWEDSSNSTKELLYKDENSGEYKCVQTTSTGTPANHTIYVKFRTCDNCVELDVTSIASILVGNLVATAGIGVAVYLVASQTRTSQSSSNKKKRSDQQTQNKQRAADSDYQSLRLGPKDEYAPLQPTRKR